MGEQKKSFLAATTTILVLMVFTYVLTIFVDCEGIGFIKWVLSPILVLGSDNSTTLIAIIVFLIVIGGISNALNKCGFMEYMLNSISTNYSKKRYKVLVILTLFFMSMGSLIGSFEEVVPLVPIAVSLSKQLGFDDLTGIAISLLAVGCGFAAGVANPFTIGVAQGIANLPMYSGVSLRLLSFVLIYILLISFVVIHARKVAKENVSLEKIFIKEPSKEKAMKAFVIIMAIGLTIVLSSSFITVIQDYTMIIIAVMFLIAGIVSVRLTNTSRKDLFNYFKEGAKDILPVTTLILMASSIRYVMEVSGLINVVLKGIIDLASNINSYELIIFIYAICLVMEAFIPSGSAKAFLLLPLLIPLATTYGISKQLCIVAYAFGDGFSNVFYPTNPALLISLGLVNVSYKDWFKYSWKFQFLNLLLTLGILMFGFAINY